MNRETVYTGKTPLAPAPTAVTMEVVERTGEQWIALDHVDAMPAFFMSIVGASDMWLFAGSNGAFTAGRVEPDRAIFPYQTADKVIADGGSAGVLTVLLARREGRTSLWRPWHGDGAPYRIRRRLLKHGLGAGIIFEETNEDLGLRFAWELATCEPFGLTRRCRLDNLADGPVVVECLDGWRHMIAPGVTQETYARLSYLAAGYMRHELVRCGRAALGIYTLNAAIVDRAEPAESLRAGVAWALGLDEPTVLLTTRQVAAFARGEVVRDESEVRGQFGALLLASRHDVRPGEAREWWLGADTWLDHSGVVALRRRLLDPEAMQDSVAAAVGADREALRLLVGGADGLQATADPVAGTHHSANVVFNIMRGGTLAQGGRFPSSDVAAFVRQRNRNVAERHTDWLTGLPETLSPADLRAAALGAPPDPHLRRLIGEYLPLSFSRRHGDPSRPWNHFAIRLKDEHGKPIRTYQGNWRDIFQNWEALAHSFPDALEPMVATFLSASTADGYNPYRITREGVDWEVVNPSDTWGHYGYWGDHQIVYLLRLLEMLERFRPAAIPACLRDPRYAYAHVPYEIGGVEAALRDPRNTIAFNHALHEQLSARARDLGGDGRLLQGPDGQPVLVSMAEKLVVPLLAKLTNLVPGGGVWLNTQRPEWNDANNALAGWGLSVVTTAYLRRYLVWLNRLLERAGNEPIAISDAVADLMEAVAATIEAIGPQATDHPTHRLAALRALGQAGEAYRSRLYSQGIGTPRLVEIAAIRRLVAAALPVIEATLRANRRADGLYHSYNILDLTADGAGIRRLDLMLEGQVSILSSGLLDPQEAASLCAALRPSDLYRADQDSYMLYPERTPAPYLARNVLPETAAYQAPFLAELTAAGDRSVVSRDEDGRLHFAADLRNAADVGRALDALTRDARWAPSVTRDREAVLAIWEQVFRHGEFTGRSSCFFMFEGIGSIYWHMVAKLLVAVQENVTGARKAGAPAETVAALSDAYRAIRDGLGYRKPPDVYGAVPTDPYSHSPRHTGAQQPGMTGQVKEEILTRWGELGILIEDGCLRFAPQLADASEFRDQPSTFAYVDALGAPQSIALPAASLAFTCCGTPVCYATGPEPGIVVRLCDGTTRRLGGSLDLPPEESAAVFGRTGEVLRIDVSRTPGG